VLADLARLHDPAANVVLGAAIVDDVLGLIVLAVVTGIAEAGRVSFVASALLLVKAVAFLALVIGVRSAPRLVGWIGQLRARGTLVVYSLVFAIALAAIADWIGLATIIGAFAAGLILSTTEVRSRIEQHVKPWPPRRSSPRASRCIIPASVGGLWESG
jgi:Kef-type K+ transport system membrane component KefB